ncbi:MAG: hypothetical protein Q8P50_13330 [Bacillota bacterium]|nr:hypothetical protein [Bacillota bacterium]
MHRRYGGSSRRAPATRHGPARRAAGTWLVLLAMAVLLSSCTTSPTAPDASGRSVLPSAKKPTIPGAKAPETPPTPFNLPDKGYPWSVSYRQNEGESGQVANVARYDIAVLERMADAGGFSAAVSKIAPSQLRIIRYDADARPKGDRRIWPGHWLLYNGTVVTTDVPSVDGVVIIGVENTSVLSDADPGFGTDDALLYAIGDDGRPDFSRSEEVVIAGVDQAQKNIIIKRAQYWTRPREFVAQKAVIATHATRTRDDTSLWVVNISTVSPTSPAGERGAQSMARLIYEDYAESGSGAAGVELDQLRWEVYAGSANARRGPDVNNDLKADWGEAYTPAVGIVNSWGLGTIDLVRDLRAGNKATAGKTPASRAFEGLGKDTGVWVMHSGADGSRAIALANGVAFDRFDVDAKRGFSSAFQRLQFLSANAGSSPRLSYTLVRTPSPAFSRPSKNAEAAKSLSSAPARLGFGTALLEGQASAYCSVDPTNNLSLGWGKDCYLDEYGAGKENKPHYLGKPLGPSVMLHGSLGREDLLKGSAKTPAGFAAKSGDGGQGVTQPSSESHGGTGSSVLVTAQARTSLESTGTFEMKPGAAYSIVFWAKGKNRYEEVDPSYAGLPSSIEVSIAGSKTPAQAMFVGGEWAQNHVTLYGGKSAVQSARAVLKFPDPGKYWIQDLEVRQGSAEVHYRVFEGGTVIVNGSEREITVPVDVVAPGLKLRAIDGTQDTTVNSGATAGSSIVIPPQDARVLVR